MVEKVLVVGGGIGGMSAALAMAKNGVTVTLIDADPAWRVYGAGITITGMSLRAFDELGVLDEIRARGFGRCCTTSCRPECGPPGSRSGWA